MSVRISSGMPCRSSAAVNAAQTGRAVARGISAADTQNRE
jgi:hypothetical protein